MLVQREQRPEVWKPIFLSSNFYDEGIGVNIVPTQPALVGLGVRDDLCLSFLTSLMLVSSQFRARVRMEQGWASRFQYSAFLGDAGQITRSLWTTRPQPVGIAR